MMLCSDLSILGVQSWLRDYDRIQSIAVILIYIQIGCSLIGSLGALYNGVLLINLAIALFALVAIESSSQSLGRTYAVLLFSAIFLDICWFILFSHEIWNISLEMYGKLVIFSVKLTLSMQIVGFSVRLSSSLLWIQMYRLGVSHVNNTNPQDADLDLRNSFLNPATPAVVRQPSGSDDVLGGSIYDPAYYSSLLRMVKKMDVHLGVATIFLVRVGPCLRWCSSAEAIHKQIFSGYTYAWILKTSCTLILEGKKINGKITLKELNILSTHLLKNLLMLLFNTAWSTDAKEQ